MNDRYGHAAGDEVIRALARCLDQGVRRGDLAAQSGGDEFCILFPGTSADLLESADQALYRAKRQGRSCLALAS